MKTYDHAKILYQILPSVYREKDNGDLEKYMQVCGTLLDQVYQTLHQRYADNFPDADELDLEALRSQPWLLPYFAKLLDVHLVSPTERGQRKEIANAIAWRKAKGTLHVIEPVAEAIGGYEVVVHEGWQRVAITPHVDMKLSPPTAYGYANDYKNEDNLKSPALAARHPGLPAATVDFKCPARAVKVSPVQGEAGTWRQSNYHGIPCHPGKFDDPTRRTPDMRTLNWQQGHYHPRHLLLFRPYSNGFFGSPLASFQYTNTLFTSDKKNSNKKTVFTVRISDEQASQKINVSNTSLGTEAFKPIKILNRVKISDLQLPAGIDTSRAYHWCFKGFYFEHRMELSSGSLELEQCAVFAIHDNTVASIKNPIIKANDCLFNNINAGSGKVQLTYCTVLGDVTTNLIEASDCIFTGYISRGNRYISPLPGPGCIRYSALSPSQATGSLNLFSEVQQLPIFYSKIFGETGAGVLHPATPRSIKNGAEDGTEMGAYHHLHLMQLDEVVIKKLQDFLPVGIQAVVIPDPTLNDYLSSQSNTTGE